jgi:hypothetical protein
MSKQEDKMFESLVAGGIIGAALGAMISKNNSGNGTLLGAIAGAAILASIKATENAKKTEIPLILEENNALFEVYSNGKKIFIKNLPKSNKILPKKFTLR